MRLSHMIPQWRLWCIWSVFNEEWDKAKRDVFLSASSVLFSLIPISLIPFSLIPICQPSSLLFINNFFPLCVSIVHLYNASSTVRSNSPKRTFLVSPKTYGILSIFFSTLKCIDSLYPILHLYECDVPDLSLHVCDEWRVRNQDIHTELLALKNYETKCHDIPRYDTAAWCALL